MDDGGWTLGLVTLGLIGFAAWAFAYYIMEQNPWHRSEPPKPSTSDFKAILEKQAEASAKRHLVRSEIPSWDEWLHHAARRLQHWWPTVSYDEARKMIRQYMEDVAVYPDPAFDWSLSAAEEIADDYMREFGENHGAND